MAQPSIQPTNRGKYVLLKVGGRFTAAGLKPARDLLDKLKAEGTKLFAFDLSQTLSIDSSFVATVAGLKKELEGKGGDVFLVDIAASPYNTLEAAGLLRVITRYNSVQEADMYIGANFTKEEHATFVLFSVVGEFKASELQPIRMAVQKSLEIGHTNIAFDLEKTTYVDSVAFGLLMNVHKRLSAKLGAVSLIAIPPDVRKILETANVLRVLREYATVDDADDQII